MDLGTSLNAIDASGRGLRVTFTKRGDRWQHTVEIVDGEQATVAIESLEGDSADAWPSSPPFQELSRELLPDKREVLFLIGRAGTSHWSASVEAEHDPPRLTFDVACRHGQSPSLLGSAYRIVGEAARLEALDGALETDPAGSARVLATNIAQRLPGTTRWKYVVQ